VFPFLGLIDARISFWIFNLLNLFAGVIVGGAFPLVCQMVNAHESPTLSGFIYAFDILGGCLGALMVSVLLLPVFGFKVVCFLSGFAILCALLSLTVVFGFR
jgi:predicted membrane-bound spermidine synthase